MRIEKKAIYISELKGTPRNKWYVGALGVAAPVAGVVEARRREVDRAVGDAAIEQNFTVAKICISYNTQVAKKKRE